MPKPLITSSIVQHSLKLASPFQKNYCWTFPAIHNFDELLISWNARRPLVGNYVILSSLLIQNQWTPWLLYAVWGNAHQYSFHDVTSEVPVRSYQDQVEVLEGHASGFQIRIEACGGATLEHFYRLYASCTSMKNFKPIWSLPFSPIPSLSMTGISQINLKHPRATSLCSPTSTTAAVQYACKREKLDPLQFANSIYDAGFDIYGNWPFNTAQAFVELGGLWECYCGRMRNFDLLWECLQKGSPVIASIKGQLSGSHLNYSQGHLVVIRGFDKKKQQFLCMDPAFPSDEQTLVSYDQEEFRYAWEQRGYLAYFFNNVTVQSN